MSNRAIFACYLFHFEVDGGKIYRDQSQKQDDVEVEVGGGGDGENQTNKKKACAHSFQL